MLRNKLFKKILTYNLIFIIFLILIGFSLRAIFLKEIPPGIANDEANIILNAQSILKTGNNIPGVVTGINGQYSGDLSGGIHSEISSHLIIPFIFLLGFNWLSIKMPFIFASIGIIIVIYHLTKRVINKEAAMVTSLIASFNPWLIFFGRAAYESIFSAFFYLLSIDLLFTLNGWKIFWALPFLLLAFLSYFSAKTLLMPILVIVLISIKIFKPQESLKPILALICFILIFTFLYVNMLSNNPSGSRLQELRNQNISQKVDYKRTISIDSPLSKIIENKFTEDFTIRMRAALGGISPSFLFLDGVPENIPSLSTPDHGPLYLIDLPLIIFGLIFLSGYSARILFLIIGLITTTMIPNFLNLAGTTYMIRTVILFPLLIMLSGIGFYYIKINLFKKSLGKLIFSGLIFLYFIFFLNFVYQYFFRLPIERNEGWFLHQRVVSRYLELFQANYPNSSVYILSQEPKFLEFRYLIHSGVYRNTENIKLINYKLANKKFDFKNITFSSICPTMKESTNSATYILDTRIKCPHPDSYHLIASLKDAGGKYIIINDKLCERLVYKTYPLIKDLRYLNIENLSTKDLCQNYIINTDIN